MSAITSNFPNYPVTEPTSALDFDDLITEVAYKLGLAYYGSDGTEQPQVPIDNHDLILCQRIVNKGIRQFINDGPKPNGWKWLNRIAQVDLWPTITFDTTNSINVSATYDSTTELATLTLTVPATNTSNPFEPYPSFFQSMELRPFWIGGNPPANTPGFNTTVDEFPVSTQQGTEVSIINYLGPNQLQVIATPQSIVPVTVGSFTAGTLLTTANIPAYIQAFNLLVAGNYTIGWSMPSQGDFTLPSDFGGQYTGEITFVANTNRGMILHWCGEASIRSRRQNYNIETGTPYECAVRLIPTPTYTQIQYKPPRQRWELMTWRIPNEFLSILFPYILHFDYLVNGTDVQPAPFSFDETVKACCLAVAEKEVEDTTDGPDWKYYYSQALPQAWAVDARSTPKALGYFGNPSAGGSKVPVIKNFRDFWYQRPTVGVNTTVS